MSAAGLMNGESQAAAATPAELIRIEAAALEQMAERLDDPEGPARAAFDHTAGLLATTAASGRRVVLTGVGKSGLIGRKIAATLRATGTPAHFLHPTEALHGDLGVLTEGDVLIALSYSGESEELIRLLPALPKLGVRLVVLTGCAGSTLGQAAAYVLDVAVEREACMHQLAPTASTTAMLALGDALAIDVSRRLDFQPQQFAELHPGGEIGRQLGRRLRTVGQLMHTGDAVPAVAPGATLPEIIHEISGKRLGMTTVQAPVDGQAALIGVLSDGDLRRVFERDGPEAFHRTAAEILNPAPRTIAHTPYAAEALALMEQHKITSLVVTADGTAGSAVVGVLHLHDILA
jgi:arabinose-5-phosphate isomerase